MIDANGTIYVLGGYSAIDFGTWFNDVWLSTDGGADRIRVGVFKGYSVGLYGTI